MKVIRFKDTQEIRHFLFSEVDGSISSEVVGEDTIYSMSGLASDREVVDLDLEGADLEAFLDKHVRPERNRLLDESDKLWIEKSSKGQDLTALNAYKQALRDLPENLDLSEIEYVDQIVWPELGE